MSTLITRTSSSTPTDSPVQADRWVQLDVLRAACEAAAQHMYESEQALHIAHQTRVDAWVTAASDKLHRAIEEHTAALAAIDAAYPIKSVEIPSCDDHDGHHKTTIPLRWVCPRCACPRGPISKGVSYDGSRRLTVDQWTNPCGHIDYYRDVRHESATDATLPRPKSPAA